MIDRRPPPPPSPARTAGLIAALFLGPLLIGMLVGPQVYRSLLWLDAHGVSVSSLFRIHFRRVVSRCVMIAAILLLVPILKRTGMASADGLGFRASSRTAVRHVLGGLLVGCASMSALYVIGLWTGVFLPGPHASVPATIVAKTAGYFVAALVIALLEEPFFRGFLFGATRRHASFWTAALITSVLFAVVHTPKPVAPPELDGTAWTAGFQLLPHLFAGVNKDQLVPTLLTLFVMGLVLCRTVERFGSVFPALGLHAGWVWSMRTAAALLMKNPSNPAYVFWQSPFVAKGYAGLAMAVVFLVVVTGLGPGAAQKNSIDRPE